MWEYRIFGGLVLEEYCRTVSIEIAAYATKYTVEFSGGAVVRGYFKGTDKMAWEREMSTKMPQEMIATLFLNQAAERPWPEGWVPS